MVFFPSSVRSLSWPETLQHLAWLSVIGLILAGTAHTDEITSIPLGTTTDGKPLTSAWQPQEGSPPVHSTPSPCEGIRFECPFKTEGLTRVYWDHPIALDLSSLCSLELDFDCPHPEAIGSLGLYLRSGKGWYLWLQALKTAGRHVLVFQRNLATSEGTPAGWNSIRALRLSFTKAADISTTVTVYGLRTRKSCALALIQGTVSVPETERAVAEDTTRRLSRWLTDLGVSHVVLDDDTAITRMATARVVMLPYNPIPPARELKALAQFVDHGGKLIVFYAADPQLAKLMHMKLGSYRAASSPGQWSRFCFNAQAPPYTPPVVFQESHNIFTVTPEGDDGRVIAYWHNANNKTGSDPAWVQSDTGCWMTHILLDGDDNNKKMMLLALLGQYMPAIWKQAAEAALARAGKTSNYASMSEAMADLRRQAQTSSHPAAIAALLQQADARNEALRTHVQDGQYPQAIVAARALQAALTRAGAMAQSSPSNEFRGVWDHGGMGLYPGDWAKTCGILSAAGITAVFPNLLWPGLAHYASTVTPNSPIVGQYGDQAAQCSQAAHKAGLEIHAWVICWTLANAPPGMIDALRRAGRLQQNSTGTTLEWMCPTHPENIAFETNAIAELARNYDLDGIQLDYIRYPDANACFCDGCRTRFEKSLGRSISGWPESARSGKWQREYTDWRCARMTAFVKSVRDLLRATKPGIKLSAAVFPCYPECVNSIGQDWGLWLQQGLIDFVCPMNYTTSATAFEAMLKNQLKLPQAQSEIYPGIGVTATESQLTPDQVMSQITAVRSHKLRGFMLFDLDQTLEQELLPILNLGIMRRNDR